MNREEVLNRVARNYAVFSHKMELVDDFDELVLKYPKEIKYVVLLAMLAYEYVLEQQQEENTTQ